MVVKLNNIHKKIGTKHILNGISFTVNKGDIVAVVGPNGAGKTSLFKAIGGLIEPDEGTVLINGVAQSNQVNSDVLFLPDSSMLYTELTGYEHLEFIAKIHKTSNQIIEAVINQIGIKKYVNEKIRNYSLGMKQHLLLAIALIARPSLIIFDEPLNGLDPSSIKMFRRIIKELKADGSTIIFSSHILAEVDKVADRIIFIDAGRTVQEVNVSDSKIERAYIFELESPSNDIFSLFKNKEFNIDKFQLQENRLLVRLEREQLTPFLGVLLENNIILNEITNVKGETDNIYHELYGEKNE
ncbi:hypothetical protein AJ85_09930 [Alkalihalobacillus alcalophilus ATCC 27647 = CGMCC 1.3604]|uniref:ABC transporter domain-containing protein n=1 Tax=Alkalihalobacillus alcalophilus ATCC 27647 = CGMCC 1.3604 TaxID=1218173 RepID=A0A4S4K155_ALKAL|nr:ABC transporter ATP-binding protein [Alkalihalobacillus alcalophilus]MED1563097.1 ABC transporter ATP-binding protein [Alkalihalobacillus alcalophilus]THG90577.1 hypothetical protein AJ85_09930 [Alkalihalobacillus alcalophilus ATCC 27647 = CGMCC 1.3604]